MAYRIVERSIKENPIIKQRIVSIFENQNKNYEETDNND